MIICKYSELKKYSPLLSCLDSGLACIEDLREKGFPTGRYEFEGGYLMVQRGETKPFAEDAFETHRKWIDVQYIIEGGEKAYYMPLEDLKPRVAYSDENDIEFFSAEKNWTTIEAYPGMVYVAFPEDGHMPVRMKSEVPSAYVKIVMKLPV